MIWLAYAAAWIATSSAVIAGIYLTGSAWCLWALLIPAMIRITRKDDKGNSVMMRMIKMNWLNKEKILWIAYAIGCVGWFISFILYILSIISIYPVCAFVALLWIIVLIGNCTI